jgi:hypothetical protein
MSRVSNPAILIGYWHLFFRAIWHSGYWINGTAERYECHHPVKDRCQYVITISPRAVSALLPEAVEDELISANPALNMREWLLRGLKRPDWVFPSAVGTSLDESNVRKAFNLILDKAELHRRGPHQMRHAFASLLLQAGEPITYVSQQLGHKDPSITLRVYAHWLPDTTERKGVDRLDDSSRSSESVAQPLHAAAKRRRGQMP